jgi:peptidyl-prolyl cis-trans isomerase B (cyclophilin B)
MKYIYILLFLLFISLFSFAQNTKVKIHTEYGDMILVLYDDTPFHKENFIKLVKDGYYNGTLFHRVIHQFMIQGGDPDSKSAKPGQMLGNGGPGYTIPAEFNKKYYHKKGALAAARMGDQVNPAKESHGSQFYIIQGRSFSDEELNLMEQRSMHIPFTEEQRYIYKTVGGAPHLDYTYTVFGEVIEGFDVIDKIAAEPRDKRDRPITDISMNVEIIK